MSFDWERSLGIFCGLDVSFIIVCAEALHVLLGSVVCDPSLAKFRWKSVARYLRFGSFRFRTFAWELSLGKLGLGTIVWQLALDNFHWELSLGSFHLGKIRVGHFAWELPFLEIGQPDLQTPSP